VDLVIARQLGSSRPHLCLHCTRAQVGVCMCVCVCVQACQNS
jgi:hypothetical protein